MTEANTTQAGTKFAGPPKTEALQAIRDEASQAIREMADKGTAQARQSYEKISAATADASNVIQSAVSTATQGAKDCNAKVIEFARTNSNSAFDYMSELLNVKSPSQFIEVSTRHARQQFEVLSEQTKELTALGQKAMLETAEPLKAGAAKVFRGPVA